MCCIYDADRSKKLADAIIAGKTTFYKVFGVDLFNMTLRSPYRSDIINFDEDGYFVSNRKSTDIDPSENNPFGGAN